MRLVIVRLERAAVVFAHFERAQDAGDDRVKLLFGERTALDRGEDAAVVLVSARGHFEIHARLDSGDAVVGGVPVADDHAFISPLLAQKGVEQPRVVRRVYAVDAVVRRHHGARFALLYALFERGQIDLAQSALIDDAVDRHAQIFVVVDCKVFERCAHARRFDAFDVGGAHLAGEIGIFGKILEIASAKRGALDVDAGTEQDVDLLIEALLAERDADLTDEVGIPRACHIDRRGERRRREGHLHAEVVVVFVLLAQTVRTVGHDKGAYPELGEGFCRPKIAAAAYRRLFAQCHTGDEIVELLLCHDGISPLACSQPYDTTIRPKRQA